MVCRRTAIHFYLEISLCARRAGWVPHSPGGPAGHGAETPAPSRKRCAAEYNCDGFMPGGSETIVCLSRGLRKGIVLKGRNVICRRQERAEAKKPGLGPSRRGTHLGWPLTRVPSSPNAALRRQSVPRTEGLLTEAPRCPPGLTPGHGPTPGAGPLRGRRGCAVPTAVHRPQSPKRGPRATSYVAPWGPALHLAEPKGQTNPPCRKN